jgi:uncharacterized integral membrane protein (TIGR00697 family)
MLSLSAMLAISMYIAFQIFADILSTKIALLPLLNLAVDGGTIIYPLTFTVRDFVHKTLGKKIARQVVVIAGILNIVMVGLFWLIGKLPADVSWGYQEAYMSILMPVARITLASIIAEVFSELIDTEIFSRIYKKFGQKDILAVLVSNGVALVVDSFIFGFVAFAGALPMEVVWQIILANVLIKGVMSLLSAPVIKWIPRRVEIDKM